MTPVISDTDLINIKEVERSVGLKNPAFMSASVITSSRSPRSSGVEPPAGYAAR